MNNIKAFLIKLHQWSLSHSAYVRPLHTAWQVGVAYLLVNASGIHNAHDLKIVAVAALAAGLSAGKSQLWPIVVSWASSTDTHITLPPAT